MKTRSGLAGDAGGLLGEGGEVGEAEEADGHGAARQNTIQVMLMRRALTMEWWESAAMKRARYGAGRSSQAPGHQRDDGDEVQVLEHVEVCWRSVPPPAPWRCRCRRRR